MECNKEEASRAMDIAKRKISENDYVGAKRFVNKAQNLYPNLYPKLHDWEQVLKMIDVFISASKGGESDWYEILGVDPLADVETVKKQYKDLALLLHPDKNKFTGAEEAFKIVSNAWSLLSERSAYDLKRKSKQVKQEKSRMQPNPPKPHQPASSSSTFWASHSAKATKETQERWKIWLEESQKEFAAAVARRNANETERLFKRKTTTTTNSTSEAERLFKNPFFNSKTTTNSTSEAERVFKKPMKSGYANSTFEAERIFKNPMTSGDASSTFEAQRLFKEADI